MPLTVLNNLICLWVTGQPDEVKTTSGRIVCVTAYMTSMVLLAAYSASLMSSLAFYEPDLPIRDLQGLLHDGSYRIGFVRDSYIYDMFHVWLDRIFVNRLFGMSWFGGEARSIKCSLFVNYVKVTEVVSLSSSFEPSVSAVWFGYYQLGLQYNKWNIRLRCKYLFQSLENKNKIFIYT